jgi:3-deoxy-D-manno-octulosonate 8-phosphate phosphatase (KDO 8-P phosphatase)|tara:strand:- start:106 stop:615 length:510 start_codon:yes stop_codon:yes gene_type:complete
MNDKTITIDDIDLFVFDFDGVLTDNIVHIDNNGNEMVSCSRADGLAFDVLRKLDKPCQILSTENNTVVSARANKLGISVLQGVKNKEKSLRNLVMRRGYKLSNILYVGNDLNDYNSMRISGLSVCPADSHPKIKKISNFVLKTNGGKGVVRELLEDVLSLDFIEILYKK